MNFTCPVKSVVARNFECTIYLMTNDTDNIQVNFNDSDVRNITGKGFINILKNYTMFNIYNISIKYLTADYTIYRTIYSLFFCLIY